LPPNEVTRIAQHVREGEIRKERIGIGFPTARGVHRLEEILIRKMHFPKLPF
jgi:hypothetical protein